LYNEGKNAQETPQLLDGMFELLDFNENGVITRDELVQAIEGMASEGCVKTAMLSRTALKSLEVVSQPTTGQEEDELSM